MTNTITNTTIDIPSISAILDENDRRNAALVAPFNPLTGEGSTGQRVSVTLSDVNDSPTTFFLPESMMAEPLARAAADLGSIERAARQLGLPLLGLVDMRDAFHPPYAATAPFLRPPLRPREHAAHHRLV